MPMVKKTLFKETTGELSFWAQERRIKAKTIGVEA